ncbi:COP23 domain-containing protein [Calothrix rhizosoleniae]|uniref:COP23 domain-containing protein n=1 Tax=Calothrix rhizosoleniae TaxID=888997 RepID=UPI000B4998CA|nr:COP23 domain-containing protein [Calothrix rhizosoleniae]
MNIRKFTQLATAITVGFITITSLAQPSYGGRSKFYCAKLNGVPITWVRTSRGRERFIRWSSNAFNVSPLERCKIVSAKFRRYYDNGRFYITGRDNVNGYPVLCISNRRGGRCSANNVLVTLQKGSDPGYVIQQILDFRRGANGTIIELSGDEFIQYVDGEFYLDVNKLVDSK